jgi:ABC-2 type transport system ATP-binding protein
MPVSVGCASLVPMSTAIQAIDLVRDFGKVKAVRGVSLQVEEGEIYGFLGPNGAGKSTMVRILVTLLHPTSGSGSVLGHDVVTDRTTVRRLIGVALQEAGLDPKQTGRELLTLQGRLYGLRGQVLPTQVAEVAELVGLTDAIDRTIKTYSGGMKRRIDLASALLHRPRVLFLDEPTTGLDPLSRALIWDRIRELRGRYGTTVFLTTQYLEEADELADRVAIIDQGQIVRQGTPAALKAEVGADVIDVAVDEREAGAARVAIDEMQASGELPTGELRGTETGYTLFVPDGPRNIAVLIRGLDRAGVGFGAVSVSRPTLDDVFLAATGGRMAEKAEQAAAEEEERAPEPAGTGRGAQ